MRLHTRRWRAGVCLLALFATSALEALSLRAPRSGASLEVDGGTYLVSLGDGRSFLRGPSGGLHWAGEATPGDGEAAGADPGLRQALEELVGLAEGDAPEAASAWADFLADARALLAQPTIMDTTASGPDQPVASAAPLASPAPVATAVPAPVATAVPAPVATAVPAPVATAVPAPVAAPAPAPVAAPASGPVATAVPAPVATPSPAPAPSTVPGPAAPVGPTLVVRGIGLLAVLSEQGYVVDFQDGLGIRRRVGQGWDLRADGHLGEWRSSSQALVAAALSPTQRSQLMSLGPELVRATCGTASAPLRFMAGSLRVDVDLLACVLPSPLLASQKGKAPAPILGPAPAPVPKARAKAKPAAAKARAQAKPVPAAAPAPAVQADPLILAGPGFCAVLGQEDYVLTWRVGGSLVRSGHRVVENLASGDPVPARASRERLLARRHVLEACAWIQDLLGAVSAPPSLRALARDLEGTSRSAAEAQGRAEGGALALLAGRFTLLRTSEGRVVHGGGGEARLLPEGKHLAKAGPAAPGTLAALKPLTALELAGLQRLNGQLLNAALAFRRQGTPQGEVLRARTLAFLEEVRPVGLQLQWGPFAWMAPLTSDSETLRGAAERGFTATVRTSELKVEGGTLQVGGGLGLVRLDGHVPRLFLTAAEGVAELSSGWPITVLAGGLPGTLDATGRGALRHLSRAAAIRLRGCGSTDAAPIPESERKALEAFLAAFPAERDPDLERRAEAPRTAPASAPAPAAESPAAESPAVEGSAAVSPAAVSTAAVSTAAVSTAAVSTVAVAAVDPASPTEVPPVAEVREGPPATHRSKRPAPEALPEGPSRPAKRARVASPVARSYCRVCNVSLRKNGNHEGSAVHLACAKGFGHLSEAARAMDVPEGRCRYCLEDFQVSHSLWSHLRGCPGLKEGGLPGTPRKPAKPRKAVTPLRGSPTRTCNLCERSFSSVQAYRNHLMTDLHLTAERVQRRTLASMAQEAPSWDLPLPEPLPLEDLPLLRLAPEGTSEAAAETRPAPAPALATPPALPVPPAPGPWREVTPPPKTPSPEQLPPFSRLTTPPDAADEAALEAFLSF